MDSELRFKVALKYIQYRKLVDRHEFINRTISDLEQFHICYNKLCLAKFRIKLIEELKTNYKFYLYLYKEVPCNLECQRIYEMAEELLKLISSSMNKKSKKK